MNYYFWDSSDKEDFNKKTCKTATAIASYIKKPVHSIKGILDLYSNINFFFNKYLVLVLK